MPAERLDQAMDSESPEEAIIAFLVQAHPRHSLQPRSLRRLRFLVPICFGARTAPLVGTILGEVADFLAQAALEIAIFPGVLTGHRDMPPHTAFATPLFS